MFNDGNDVDQFKLMRDQISEGNSRSMSRDFPNKFSQDIRLNFAPRLFVRCVEQHIPRVLKLYGCSNIIVLFLKLPF
jgi:hypothetical protein